MLMSLKFPFCIFALTIVLIACGPSLAAVATATAVPQEVEITAIPTQPTAAATQAAAVPKHKDLTFVEFFAVT